MHQRFRANRLLTGAALTALIAFVPSCGKKQSGGGDPAVAPPAASTDHFVFAHVNGKQVRTSAIFKELKDAFIKGDLKTWDDLEKSVADKIGVKPSNIESATVVVPDAPGVDQGPPPLILIMVADIPIPRRTILNEPPREAPDRPGFYLVMDRLLVHFPDEKTLVLLHPTLADRYLNGYAKDRTAWPLSPDLIKAAQDHTLYVSHKPNKWPVDMRRGREMDRFIPLFEANSATLTIDLKGKEFSIGVSGTFPNAKAAATGKVTVDKLLAEAAREIGGPFNNPKDSEKFGSVLPLVKEAYRALTEAKVSVSGMEVTASTVFKADFNVWDTVKDAVEKVRAAAARSQAQNNLHQIGMAIHNYASANNGDGLIVYAMGKTGGQVNSQVGKNGELIHNPPALLSWRVALLPYIEQVPLYNQFKLDEPWDSEHNKKLIDKMPKIYASITKPAKPGMTHLQQVIGPNCMLPGRYNIGNIPDGTMNTVAVIEAAEPVIWTRPDDVFIPETDIKAPPPKDLKKKFGGQFENRLHVLMYDGAVRYYDTRRLGEQSLWNALRPADGNPLGLDW